MNYAVLLLTWLDGILVLLADGIKTYLREIFRAGSQLVSMASKLVLLLVNRDSLKYQVSDS